jgi:hypothetical protein
MDLDTDSLLKIILALVVVWLVLEVVGELIQTLEFILVPLPKLFGIVVIVLIVLYFLDRL